MRIAVGGPIPPGEVTAFEHFLTARWLLFSASQISASQNRVARAFHTPWPLHRATARLVDDQLMTAAGLPGPEGAPLVHYSPGVDVAIGRPEK